MRKKIIIVCIALLIIVCGVVLYSQLHSDIKLSKSDNGIRVTYTTSQHKSSGANLTDLTGSEILNNNQYIIVRGTVKKVQNLKIKFGMDKSYGALVTIDIDKILKESLEKSEVTVFVDCPVGTTKVYEDSDTMSVLEKGDDGIFIIREYDDSDIWEENGRTLYMSDLADYGFDDAMRFAFIEKDNQLIFNSHTYKNITANDSLDDVEKYIVGNDEE